MHAQADLRLCCSHMAWTGFLMTLLICFNSTSIPVFSAPVWDTPPGDISINKSENINVGETILDLGATYTGGGTLTYSIVSQTNGDHFEIDGTTVKLKADLDYETYSSHVLVFGYELKSIFCLPQRTPHLYCRTGVCRSMHFFLYFVHFFCLSNYFCINMLCGICLRNRSALAVNWWVIIHCLEVNCKGDQIMSAKREWCIYLQLTDKEWIITQQFMH